MTDSEKVQAYMDVLDHPLKPEIEAVRTIIKGASPHIAERIKWNAPSYYYKEDLLTIHVKALNRVHIIFHHVVITDIISEKLEGDYKDRRMMYFNTMKEIKTGKKELEGIIQKLVQAMDKR